MGRRIAIGIFWLCLAYIVAVGFYSVPVQVFRPDKGGAIATTPCAAGIRGLEDELLERQASHMRRATAPSREVASWLEDWDRRHAALSDRCQDSAERPYRALERLRQRVATALVRLDREQSPLARSIDRGLESLPPEQPSTETTR